MTILTSSAIASIKGSRNMDFVPRIAEKSTKLF